VGGHLPVSAVQTDTEGETMSRESLSAAMLLATALNTAHEAGLKLVGDLDPYGAPCWRLCEADRFAGGWKSVERVVYDDETDLWTTED
jgi:hypothetical protein